MTFEKRNRDATAAAPETFVPAPPGEPARDVSDAPPPPELLTTDPVSQESQWALVWREYRKRPTAVIAAALILLLVTASVFAPFLANDRPLAYRGANRFFYSEAYRTVRVLLPRLSSEPSETKRESLLRLTEQRLDDMAAEVVPETATEVANFKADLSSAMADGLQPDEVAALRSQFGEFSARQVGFVGHWHFPVTATLHGLAVGFLVANAILLVLLLAKAIVRRTWRRTSRRLATACLLGLPVAAGLLWHFLVPARNDRTLYKQGVLAAEAVDSDAPVLYESVIWPPIAYGFDEIDQDRKYAPPELFGDTPAERKTSWDGRHWLGTDKTGRDVLSRMLWGGRISLSVGLVAVGIYIAIGVVVGSIAGFFRGWADMLISRVIEIVIVFPTFFLILTIVAFIGPSLMNIMVVIGLTGWTGVARLVRGEFLRLADQEFVLAGRALGYSAPRLIFRHVLPNAIAPVLVAATFGIAGAILTESALSFLGLGITIPTPSWGGILAEGRATTVAPWLIYLPGLAIFVTILSYNLAGEALRDASDPRLRGSR